ncbi:hypothetical protein FF2_045211 [Malus domestica]
MAVSSDFNMLEKALSVQEFYTAADLEMWGLEFEPKPDSLLIYYLFNKLIGKPLPTVEMIKHLVSGKKNFPDPTFIPPENFSFGSEKNKAFFFVPFVDEEADSSLRFTVRGSFWRFSSEKSINHLHNGEEVRIGTARTFIFFKNIQEEGGYEMVEYKLLNSKALGIDPRLIQSRSFNDLLQLYSIVAITCHDGNLEKIKKGIVAPALLTGGGHQIILPPDADIGAKGSIAPLIDHISVNPDSRAPSPAPQLGLFGLETVSVLARTTGAAGEASTS